jgi:predicted RNA-binding Zn-ribbon protein involved in translation (DUF1610 family)
MPAPNPAQSAWLKRLGIPSGTAVPNGQNRTTAPKPAPPATSPLPYTNRPRTAGLFICTDCGQSWHVEPAGGTFTRQVTRFCPACGTDALTRTTDTFGGLECGAIKALRVERLLAQLLYEHWAANLHAEQAKYPRYVDYLKAQLAGTGE